VISYFWQKAGSQSIKPKRGHMWVFSQYLMTKKKVNFGTFAESADKTYIELILCSIHREWIFFKLRVECRTTLNNMPDNFNDFQTSAAAEVADPWVRPCFYHKKIFLSKKFLSWYKIYLILSFLNNFHSARCLFAFIDIDKFRTIILFMYRRAFI